MVVLDDIKYLSVVKKLMYTGLWNMNAVNWCMRLRIKKDLADILMCFSHYSKMMVGEPRDHI